MPVQPGLAEATAAKGREAAVTPRPARGRAASKASAGTQRAEPRAGPFMLHLHRHHRPRQPRRRRPYRNRRPTETAAEAAEAGRAAGGRGLGNRKGPGGHDPDAVRRANCGSAFAHSQLASGGFSCLQVLGRRAHRHDLGPGLTVVVVLSAPVVVDVRPPAKAKRVPCTVMVDPDTAVTLPTAKATVPAGRVTVVRGRVPAPGKVPPVRPPKPPPPNAPPPPPPKPRLQVPLVDEKIVTLVAFTAPAEPFEPVAVMHTPTFTSLRLAFRVAVIVVEAVRSTVVWPVSVFCTSRVLPVMLAMLPVAAGPNAGRPPAPRQPPPRPVGSGSGQWWSS